VPAVVRPPALSSFSSPIFFFKGHKTMNDIKQTVSRGIRLSLENGRFFAATNHCTKQQSFPLPPFPSSQCRWISRLADLFYRQHGRCMAVSLMLDQQRWLRPQIPTQRCDKDGVSWCYRPEDYADRPASVMLGGSYQTAIITSVDEVLARVPQHDGLHMLCAITGSEPMLYAVLTINSETRIAAPGQFMTDDWLATLDHHTERMIIS
jgi:hypothetical protein